MGIGGLLTAMTALGDSLFRVGVGGDTDSHVCSLGLTLEFYLLPPFRKGKGVKRKKKTWPWTALHFGSQYKLSKLDFAQAYNRRGNVSPIEGRNLFLASLSKPNMCRENEVEVQYCLQNTVCV